MSLVLGTPSRPQLSLFGPPVPHLQNGCPGDDLTGLIVGLRETTAVRPQHKARQSIAWIPFPP